jgi:hypothetical protein
MEVIAYVLAYTLPAGIIWGLLALVVHPLASLSQWWLLAALVYALIFGLSEALALPLRSPSLTWQVPAQWLRNRPASVQTLIWGITLGPGFVTRNPYAGMWLLPLFLAFNQPLLASVGIGIAIGIAHGGSRSFGILAARSKLDACGSIILTQWRWRVTDGLLLLFGSGYLAVSVLTIFLEHLY